MKRGSAISVGFSVGISMSILFSVIFCKALENYAGIGVGICFGVALGVLTFVIFRVFQNSSKTRKRIQKMKEAQNEKRIKKPFSILLQRSSVRTWTFFPSLYAPNWRVK